MPTFVLTLAYSSDDEEASTAVESVIQHLIDEPGPLTFTAALIALEDGTTIDLLAPIEDTEPRAHAASAYTTDPDDPSQSSEPTGKEF